MTYVVETGKPYPRGFYNCPECQRRHLRKAIHLRLDANGEVIVSGDIYLALLPVMANAGLETAGEVKAPPPMFIGSVDKDKARIVEVPLNLDQAPDAKIVPGRTRYESRDIMTKPFVQVIDAALEEAERKTKPKNNRTILT